MSICLSVYLSICLSICLSVYLSIYLSVYLSVYLSICLSVYLSICLSVYLSICLSIYLSVYLSVYLSICLSVYLSICLSVYLSICLSVYLSICLSVYLSICLSVYLSICLSVYLSIYLPNHDLSATSYHQPGSFFITRHDFHPIRRLQEQRGCGPRELYRGFGRCVVGLLTSGRCVVGRYEPPRSGRTSLGNLWKILGNVGKCWEILGEDVGTSWKMLGNVLQLLGNVRKNTAKHRQAIVFAVKIAPKILVYWGIILTFIREHMLATKIPEEKYGFPYQIEWFPEKFG